MLLNQRRLDLTLRERLAILEAEQTREDYRAVVRAVAECEHRGLSLPHTEQTEGCGCGELYGCQAKGVGVSTADCLACRCTAMGITT